MSKLKGAIGFIYENFGPLAVFYLAHFLWGLKPAIAISLVFTIAEIIRHKIKRLPFTAFFKFSVAMTLIFGVLDLTLENAVFFKLEPSITNLFTAFFFGITLFQPKPLIQELAEQQGRTSSENSADKTFFFRLLTLAWTLYFVAKAVAYLWIGFNSSLEHGLVLRMIIGKLSFWMTLGFSIGLGRPMYHWLARMRVLPSTRAVALVKEQNL